MDKELDEKLNKIEASIEEVKKGVAVNETNILVGFEEAKQERLVIKSKIDETYNAVDGFVKVVTKLEQEFTMLKEDLRRVKTTIKEKLGVDLF